MRHQFFHSNFHSWHQFWYTYFYLFTGGDAIQNNVTCGSLMNHLLPYTNAYVTFVQNRKIKNQNNIHCKQSKKKKRRLLFVLLYSRARKQKRKSRNLTFMLTCTLNLTHNNFMSDTYLLAYIFSNNIFWRVKLQTKLFAKLIDKQTDNGKIGKKTISRNMFVNAFPPLIYTATYYYK